MRILIAAGIYYPDIGGPATYAKYLVNELPNRGVRTGEPLVYAEIAKKWPKGLSHFVYFLDVLRRSWSKDLILVTDPISAGFPVYLASFISGKPYVLKIGGDYVWEQSFQRFGVKELLDQFLEKKYSLRIKLMRSIQSRVAKRAAIVIAPSNYLADVAEKWGVERSKIKVIYNSVSQVSRILKKEAREKLGVGENEVILFSGGRDVPWKGFSVVREITIPNAKIVVGQFPKETYELWLSACDIYLLNTGYEGFSHQLLEAMTLGKPIITTNVGGNKEIAENGENALVVEYNDKEAWIREINRLIADKELQKKLSENAKATAQKFLAKDMVGETINVLRQVIRIHK